MNALHDGPQGAANPPAFVSQMTLYREWLALERGMTFASYAEMRHWSTTDLEAFWQTIWDYHDIWSPTPYQRVLADDVMPGARWFPGAQVNYAREVLRHGDAAHAVGQPAVIAEDEVGNNRSISWPELRRQVASFALSLKELGVERGDRVVAYMPNIPETVVAFLASASLGAIWSVCAPDMGLPAIRDRFRQVDPKVLIAADGVFYAGKALDKANIVEQLVGELPSLCAVILLETEFGKGRGAADMTFSDAAGRDGPDVRLFQPEPVPFDHPLWILYSSGTTGLPKALVHGHGGIILNSLVGAKHVDIGPSYAENSLGERYHWYSSTSWVMWNAGVNAMLAGATLCLFDGSPSGSKSAPNWDLLWRFAARNRVTLFGAGAAFYMACQKADIDLSACGDLSRIRMLGSTGSPLPETTERWGRDAFRRIGTPKIWWCNTSGGTDICANFATGNRELAARSGRMQCRQLGTAVEAWDSAGRPLMGQVGELVCTRPIPSMPLFFWGDDGDERYRQAYFDKYPGVWCHGDWIEIDVDETVGISGRSDATINRAGLRIGSSEIYAALETCSAVEDALVVDVDTAPGSSALILFVVPRGPVEQDQLEKAVADAIRSSLSPRFLPDIVVRTPSIPRTLSGKKLEVPVKRILSGWEADSVLDRSSLANPQSVDWFVDYAAAWRKTHVPLR